jgi:hypothetical protein
VAADLRAAVPAAGLPVPGGHGPPVFIILVDSCASMRDPTLIVKGQRQFHLMLLILSRNHTTAG